MLVAVVGMPCMGKCMFGIFCNTWDISVASLDCQWECINIQDVEYSWVSKALKYMNAFSHKGCLILSGPSLIEITMDRGLSWGG